MKFRLDHYSGEPIYRQIAEQIKYALACGWLTHGEKLPSIRDLARELKINARTVVNAYEELQNVGVVVMRQGQGVFAVGDRPSAPTQVRRRTLEDMVRRLLSEAARLGADKEELLGIIAAETEKMESDK